MRRTALLLLVLAVRFAMAAVPQQTDLPADILGAHNIYGRGCPACHAPHRGASATRAVNADQLASGSFGLWSVDLSSLYGQIVTIGGSPVVLPTPQTMAPHDPETTVLVCLSCHDGNLAPGGMRGTSVEMLPGGQHVSTLLDVNGSVPGFFTGHPVGRNVVFRCGAPEYWDCTITAGKVQMNGRASSAFASNYTFAVRLPVINGSTPVVTCTSCHDPHSMSIFAGTVAGVKGYFPTMFFLRGYYNPWNGGNSTSQFCRQCHGGMSNEMYGQLQVPTT